MPVWLQIVLAIIGSSSLSTIIVKILDRVWSKKDKKDGLEAKLDEIIKEIRNDIGQVKDILNKHIREDRESDIRNARRDILRFNDEIRRGTEHSAESFDDILEAIDAYERYCNSHPDFENNKAIMAIANIKRVYQERLQKNDFL